MKGNRMNVKLTARHFKAHDALQFHAINSMKRLEEFYDGIINAELILSYEKPARSIKTAELLVTVQGSLLKALEKSDDFIKSIDAAMVKLERQLKKFKSKQREKKKTVIRKTQAKV